MRTSRSVRRTLGLGTAALVLWLVAALYVSGTVKRAASARARNAARAAALAEISPVMERLVAHGALRAHLIETLDAEEPLAIRSWLGSLAPQVPSPELRERRASAAGWNVLTLEAEWSTITLEAFGEIVFAAEARVPPLRLVAVTIDPLSSAGSAKVSAVFETVERSGPIPNLQ